MSHHILTTILRREAKQTSYKIALVRALNDVVLTYPEMRHDGRDIAVPLAKLAEHWIAYYWPFADPDGRILQGYPSQRAGQERQDISFRSDLTDLRRAWQRLHDSSSPADGFLLIDQMRVPRKRLKYDGKFLQLYQRTLAKITHALRQPIRYAGPDRHQVFPKPQRLRDLEGVQPLPGAAPGDSCLRVPAALWRTFRDVSLWAEALCVHEWCLLTERLDGGVGRGQAYQLLTEHPASRLPLTWERNQIDLLMREGVTFTCPWTGKRLSAQGYDLDHVIPVSAYPFNEMWNLVPADRNFNQHRKRDRLPDETTLERAMPAFVHTYGRYRAANDLGIAFREDVALRFSIPSDPIHVTQALRRLVVGITQARNLETF